VLQLEFSLNNKNSEPMRPSLAGACKALCMTAASGSGGHVPVAARTDSLTPADAYGALMGQTLLKPIIIIAHAMLLSA
jgi:hypothetical protein